MSRTYTELMQIKDFKDRFEYLSLKGTVGAATFGSSRYLNQLLYRDPRWRSLRRRIIIRDKACDLAHPDFEIQSQAAFVHHIEPITIEDILDGNPKVFDEDNLITTVFLTHQAIHYGGSDLLPSIPVTRLPNDTCPWR